MATISTPSVSVPTERGFLGSLISRLTHSETFLGYAFILPSLIGFVAFFGFPAVRSLVISFHDWNLLRPSEFVGLDNYSEIFADERFWRALLVTVQYVVWNIPLQTVIAIGMALILNRIHNSTFLRGLFVLPWLIPNVIVAMLFLWILDPSIGIMNVGLRLLGLPQPDWFNSPDSSIPTVAFVNIWRHAGYNAILIFAGLKTIPKSLYEAAQLDGANDARQFFGITLPLLRPVLVFVLVTSVIGSFQIFDTIAVTTSGGPAGSTRTIIYYIYQEVFERTISMGTATAASVVLFAILVTVTLIQTRYLRADRSDLADYQ